MNESYSLKKVIPMHNTFPYEESIDATYIIHLVGNGREENIQKQLLICNPTETIYILYNQGYKKSNKNLPVNNSVNDLIDAYLYILRDSKKKGYDSILIMEDDFIFDLDIIETNNISNINSFLNKKKDELCIYSYGVLPYLMVPYDENNNYIIIKIGCHCSVYTKKCRDYILTIPQDKILDWDYFCTIYITNYCYSKPLCYQLFTTTENYENWGSFYGIFSLSICYLVKKYIKYYKLDKTINSYPTVYKNALYLFWILYIIIAWILIWIIILFYKHLYKLNK